MPYRVLIADDDKEIVEIISDSLTDEGFLVSRAYNGQQVLDQMQFEKIDICVLDIMMPEMDGLETLNQASSNPQSCNSPWWELFDLER